MAQKEAAGMAAEQASAIAATQREFAEAMAKVSQRWLDRAASEAKLASELGSKLAAVRSLPDGVEAYQQWMTERAKTFAGDMQQFMSDCQTLMQEATRMVPKSWPGT